MCPLLIISPVLGKREVPTCDGAQFYCIVLLKWGLLPGRDDVRGGDFFSVYYRSSASEAGARTAVRKRIKISAFNAPHSQGNARGAASFEAPLAAPFLHTFPCIRKSMAVGDKSARKKWA